MRELKHTSITGQVLRVLLPVSDDDVLLAIEDLTREKVIGFDTETTFAPGFEIDSQGGLDPFKSRLRLIQLAKADGTVYVFQNKRCRPPKN